MILLQHAVLLPPEQPTSSPPMSVATRPAGTLQLPPQKPSGQEASLPLAGEEEFSKGGEQDCALEELCKPLYCRLCNVTLNSAQQAQAHYQGKNHGKKLRNYYAANSCPPPARMSNVVEPAAAPVVPAPPQMGSFKPGGRVILATENDYCKLCDASFSSPAVAQAHYQGKNHAKRLRLAEAQSNSFSESSELGQRRARKEGNEFKQVLTSIPALGRESHVIWPCVSLRVASFTAQCVTLGLAKRLSSGSIWRASNIRARCPNSGTGVRWRIWAMCSDSHATISSLSCLLFAFCQLALLCGHSSA
nr:zinc finger matrin-type protein 3 isoform X1 [Aotus nancymaae]XP_012327689.1 zinc finger matrin-type protein 3 isoform X1 [Aotus nancymaae]XP_012327690.1 zinc finger matrin-type protein 3 isoform X1 [Aotus nancymaae]XP_012327691.1 zinc finger matrin-type protein 3 isoform X1 [Aotus nancymaae]XP_012327692.1 zinc finger matrin-type protein 3 isoform X1 [Aotus nancymaae]XP_012327693.1 zinc finger matrin-type protein 3 isoform X1 [Aotus nancymaae]XP_012327694.1 zinc finger matrin-type protein 